MTLFAPISPVGAMRTPQMRRASVYRNNWAIAPLASDLDPGKMSEMGQSRHFGPAPTTSGLAPDKRTFSDYRRHAPNVPGTEVGSFSLYHLVREREQALRESGANHVSRLFVYDEFKSRGCWIGESPGGVPRRSFVT